MARQQPPNSDLCTAPCGCTTSVRLPGEQQGTLPATTQPRATACLRALHSMCAFGTCAFPPGKGCGMCQAGLQLPGVFAGKQHPPAQPWRSAGASKCHIWTAQDTNGLLGMWQSSYGFFGSSSTVTDISSFTPAGIETTMALLASTGELFGLCCSNQAEVWGELSARCDGVCQRWISNP